MSQFCPVISVDSVQDVEGPHRSRSAICLPGNPDVLYPPLVLYAIMAGGTETTGIRP